MSLITCISWVPKGFAKSNPTIEKITPEDLAEIKLGEGMDLENYDNEEPVPEFANAEYEPQLEGYEDKSEAEDNIIEPTDSLIVAGVQNGDFSELQVYVYVQETSSLYVHHDLIIPAYPLSLQWLPYNPASPGSVGNCMAVGSFLPEIEIWDLDVLEVLEPVKRLGGLKRVESKSGKKRKKTKTYRKGSHHDAVISLDLHPIRKNYLASGSADMKVKLWDILEGKCLTTLDYHQDKVQAVKWHLTEEKIIASGGIQGYLHVKAADNPKTGFLATVPSSIESLNWNPFSSHELSISTEDGFFYKFDARSLTRPLFEGKVHSGSFTHSYSPGLQNLVATAGKDKVIKIWDFSNMQLVAERDARVDELFCVEFNRDLPFVLAAGGLSGELAIWDTEENENIMDLFMRTVSQQLQDKFSEFMGCVEPQQKEIIAKSYECMVRCYRLPGGLEDCGKCAGECQENVLAVQREMRRIGENIEGFVGNCIEGCRIGKGENELKECISECVKEAVEKLDKSAGVAQGIVSKYV